MWTRRSVAVMAATMLAATAVACGDVNQALHKLSEARHLAADLLVQFTAASDAANRAVMAVTDESSAAYARESQQAKDALRKDLAALRPILDELRYTDERKLLDEFAARFDAYDAVDVKVLSLAVENTNLKAQQLSFGSGMEAADAFRDALAAARQAGGAARASAATAEAALREIQTLQAPHIAEADDAAMTRIEARMATAEATIRTALASLSPTQGDAAMVALDRFLTIHRQVLELSRRNTNVRSLSLSLDDKRRLTTQCEESLRALRAALARRGYPAGRTS